ncbi:hypothetical protein ACH5RR_016883 [Cinchona calisaya]|uniref:Uncharacterized protein n=1 Tax=Cinchona calisaya TaxID=153742 RepID=A0ABD2ZXA3_9GENT
MMAGAAKANNQLVLNFNFIRTLILFSCLVFCKYSSAARPLTNELYPQNLSAEKDLSMMEEAAPAATHHAKLGGIFGTLVLNVLPKGTIPASGPSRRSHAIQT